ncbi:tetratricopeptide repeat protein [Teredinibacter sp. KSP-S5-2]|uniref:tetratricopeptide repeat protein n=1 Tax=Teredinibacter sp. KSP-S5-2 TaxID=3034506 RepID=UPI002934168B|nr:tetratricopeptide repeat protein [Teredinibacter sp. KSP-S5-2]WNO08855.1 response regulator [Teredinibacter sp. KSP-S5-2]
MNPLLAEDGLKQIDIVKIYNNKKCLVIDDFPEIRGSLTRTLKTFGAQSCDTAADGEEAIKLCSKKRYDIVLCDYNLGAGKDGQQILEEVRYLRVLLMTSLFVMITGESSREMVLGALECQPDDYITKPYTQASLKVRLNKAIVRHEALLPIKKAISDGDYRNALELCNDMIANQSKYSADCLKMKGQLHFLLKQLKEAQALYESVLGKKPVMWARLGMSKTLLAQKKYDAAEKMLSEIIAEDDRYIEAHDMLTELHLEKKETQLAQKSTEKATQISPKSVLRHRRLAKLAEQNHDDEIALKSYQHSIKWGLNSCHESEQDYFNYARKAADVTKGDQTSDAKMILKQANTFLDRARKRYADRPEVTAQAQMVETQLLLSEGKEDKAAESAQKAKQLYNGLSAPNLETSLEFARTLHALDEEDEAREVLAQLAARHENNAEVMQIIDGITGEPISDTGKQVAAKLTKQGIGSYEQKNFETAISVFEEALFTYPKHVGLNLNLIQAILADTEATGCQDKYEKLCRKCLRAVGNIPPDHKQHKRYAFLYKQLEKHYPAALI